MKPNIKFLQKVAAGDVAQVKGYTPKRGGYTQFVGGEKTARAHAQGGYIVMPGSPSLGRPSVAELTDAGRKYLEDEKAWAPYTEPEVPAST